MAYGQESELELPKPMIDSSSRQTMFFRAISYKPYALALRPSALLIRWACSMLGGFGHGLRCVRRVTRNAAGHETGNDDQCHNESWYKTHHHDSPVLTHHVSRTTLHGSRGNATC
jgi:hypothetical protein